MDGILGYGVVDPLVDLVVAECVEAGEVTGPAAAEVAELRWCGHGVPFRYWIFDTGGWVLEV